MESEILLSPFLRSSMFTSYLPMVGSLGCLSNTLTLDPLWGGFCNKRYTTVKSTNGLHQKHSL